MRQVVHILITILLFSFSSYGQKPDKNDIEGFNKFLGQQRAKAFNEAIDSYDKFLRTNFPNQDSQSDRAKAFLIQISKSIAPDSSWTLTTEENKKILEQWETSGLRKEILIYGYEDYEPKFDIHKLSPREPDTVYDLGELDLEMIEEEIIPITGVDSLELAKREKKMAERLKNSLWTNVNGEFLYGLAKYAPNDSFVQDYVDVKVLGVDISPSLMVSACIEQVQDLDEPFIKRVLLVEIYYWIMNWDIERKEKK